MDSPCHPNGVYQDVLDWLLTHCHVLAAFSSHANHLFPTLWTHYCSSLIIHAKSYRTRPRPGVSKLTLNASFI